MGENNAGGLFDALVENGYSADNLGGRDGFVRQMNDPDYRKRVYDMLGRHDDTDALGEGTYTAFETKYGAPSDKGYQDLTRKAASIQPEPRQEPRAQSEPQALNQPQSVSPKDDEDNRGYWGKFLDNFKASPSASASASGVPYTAENTKEELERERREKERKRQEEYDATATGVSADSWGQYIDEWNNFVATDERLDKDIAEARGESGEKGKDILHTDWEELGNKEGFLDKDTWAIRADERKREDELLKQREQYVRQMLKGQQVFKEQGGTDKPVEIEQDGQKVWLTSGGYTTDDKAVAQLATTQYNDAVAELEAQTKSTKEQVGDLVKSINKGIEARKEELQNKLQEDFEKNPLATATMMSANPDFLGDDMTLDTYKRAERKLKQVQNFIRIAEKYRDDDISFRHAFGYGVQDKATDIGTYDFGFNDMATAAAACEILKKTEKGEKLKPEEEALLDAYALEYAARSEYAQYIGRGYGAGQQLVEFGVLAAQLAANPFSGVGAGAEKAFMGWLEKKGLGYLTKGAAGYASRFLANGVAHAAPSAFGLSLLQTPEWLATGIEGTMDFQTNGGEEMPEQIDTGAGVYLNNEGRRQQIKGGIARSDKSLAQSIGESYKSQLIGDWAMMMVPEVGKVTGGAGKGVAQAAEKVTPKFVADYISKVGTQEAVRGFDSFLKAVDLPKRSFDFYASMQLGNILDAATPGGQEFHNGEGTGVLNLDRQIDEYVNALMFETAMGAARGASYGWGRYQLGRRFNAQYQNMEAGTWRDKKARLAELTELFESGDEQQTADAMKSLFADQSLTREQIQDALELGGLSAQRHFTERMFNETLADERSAANKVRQGLIDSFNEGLQIVNPNLRIDEEGNVTEATGDGATQAARDTAAASEANGKYNILRQEVLTMCGEDILAQLDENPQGTLGAMRNTGVDAVTLQACQEYAEARQKMLGIDSALRGDEMVEAIQSAQAIRMRQQKDGMLHHATLKDGRRVDILGETGTSATVIDERGDISMVPMSDIAEIGETESADDLIKREARRINDEYSVARQELYNPQLQFQPGDVYDIEMPDGSRGKVTVIWQAFDPETGVEIPDKVRVQMPDGTEQEMDKSYIQQQWDLARSTDWANEINESRRRQIEEENEGEIPDQWKPKENEPTEPNEPENPTNETPVEGEGEAGGTEGGEGEAEGGTETPEEQPEQRTYGIGDKVRIVDDQGNVIDAEVTQAHPDGTLIVEYEGGQKPYTQEALNEAEAEAREAQQPAEQPAETPGEQPAEQPAEEQPRQQSALEKLPKTENGKPDFNKAENAAQLVDAKIEYFKGDKQSAKRNIMATLGGSQAELQAAQEALDAFNEAVDNLGKPTKGKKGKKKGPQIKLSSDSDENAELQLSLEDAVEKAQQKVDYWQAGIDEITRREEAERQAEQAQLDAERAALVQAQELKDVPDYTSDNGEDARARGFRNVNGQRVDRQTAEQFKHRDGNEVTIQFSLGEARKGHVALVEADNVQASHRNDGTANPLHFIADAQPKEWTSTRRNDIMARIMELPNDKREVVPLDMKQLVQPITAYVGAPSVNARGEVIQGNGRTVLINEMYKGTAPKYKEQAAKYRQYLRDHAEELGFTPEEVDAMKKPMVVNVLDVDDGDAVKLGRYTSKDMETGGVERINASNTVAKLGDKMPEFIRRLMKGADEGQMSLSDALNTKENVDAALKYLLDEGAISQTEFDSAHHPNKDVTKDAKEDLKRILQECIFQGANENLRTEFEKLPTKAQNALLVTSWRNLRGKPENSLIPDIQEAVHLYNVLLGDKEFSGATGKEKVRNAVRAWRAQLGINLTSNEGEQSSKRFSNFAIELATRFKTEKQSDLAAQLMEVYDLIQPSAQLDLITDRGSMTLEDAIKKVFDIDYDGKKRGVTLAGDNTAGEGGEQGESGNPSGGEPGPQGAGGADGAGGAQGNAEATVTEPPHTRTAAQEKRAKERREAVEGEVKKMTDALGTTVRILDSIDQVRDKDTRAAIEAGDKSGLKVTGWYDPVTGEVVVYYPNLIDANEAKLTYLHEVVGHKGLRALFGDKFEDTMKDVYRRMPKRLQDSVQKRMDDEDFKSKKYSDPLVASVEEELSNWAEKSKKPGWWGRTVSSIRDMIRKVVDLEMTDADIDYLLWRSRHNLEEQTLQQRATDKVLGQRARKANEEARSNQAKVQFRTREEEEIISKAREDGTLGNAPNGKESELFKNHGERTWAMVRTPQFKNWFGDWEKGENSSKVVDGNGEPLVVYHGTVSDEETKKWNGKSRDWTVTHTPFTVFRRNANGERNAGFWFSSNADVAGSMGFNFYETFLNARNPLVVDCNRSTYADIPFDGKRWDGFDLASYAEKNGYDGLILRNISDGADLGAMDIHADDYVVFKSNQVKSVENNGEFSTTSNDIRFRTREEKQQAHDRAQQISDEAEKRIADNDRVLEQRRINSLAQELGMNGYELPENVDLDNTEGLVVREAARQGTLKDALGERWDEFLKKVYQNTDEETLRDINEFARLNGWNFNEATERYLASLSDNGAFEQAVERGMWDGVKSAFDEMLRSKGVEDGIPDNDARYALWRNERNKSESPNSTLLARATEVATDNALSNGNSPMFRIRQDDPNDPKVLYRNGVNEPAEVARRLEKTYRGSLFQMTEAWQDSMQALYEFMKACEGSDWKGEAEVADWMNPYTRENRLSSKNEDDINVFTRKCLAPMFDEAKKLAKNDRERRLLNNYIISKHGLERNEYMAEREARRAFEEQMKSQKSDATWDDLTDEAKEALVSQARRDYAGLTGLFGLKGEEWQQAEAEARELVDSYETAHDTDRLWKTINATSESILKKQLDTGLISKETYDKIKGMYKYYVPLRGFEETTTDDEYAYLNYQRGEFNNPIRRAEGRTSLANDPFESLAGMAQSGIIYGNRNQLVKQAFYNFVKAHPSDYVTESPLWLRKGEDGEWEAVFCDTLKDGDSPDVVSRKLAEFERRMKQAQEEYPDLYATGRQAHSLPYKMPDKTRISEHQVVVRIGGRDKVLTVNGNPRLAQAINGKTNPDVPMQGWQQALNKWTGSTVRFLSQVHTTWNPDFIISNYLRDVGYSNVMAWVKETGLAPEYAGRFAANTARCNPGTMLTLLDKRRRGTLNTEKGLGGYFEEFMGNGGETGYARMADRDKIAKDIRKKLHVTTLGATKDAIDAIGEMAGELGRAVELSQRFAAFVTSRESGRDVGRSIYDAKEISVNFNKKGAGSTFVGRNGQTWAGDVVGLISGAGRDLFMFWNAGVQGTANITRNTFRSGQSAAKAATAFGTLMLLGYMRGMSGGDEEKEKKDVAERGDSYWDLPTYTRRTSFCFRGKGGWTTIPISIELRLPYGVGEIMGSYARGHEKDKDLVWDVGDLLGNIIFPVNFLEGQEAGSHDFLMPFVPSPFRPTYEAARNRSWSGRRIYSPEMPWNEGEPRYQRAYRNTDKVYIGLSKGVSDLTGGDEFEGGAINLPPEALQYMFQQYFPFYTTMNQGLGLYRDVTGQKDFSWRDVPIANRIKKDSGEQLHRQAVSRDYWENKKDADALVKRVKKLDKKERYDEADEIMESQKYWNAEEFQDYEKDISDAMKDASDPDLTDEEREEARRELMELQEEANAIMRRRAEDEGD